MTKTQAAFIMSVDRLFEISKRVYFWTFTFKNTYPDWWYPVAWSRFSRDVKNLYGGYICGLRVVEPHPNGHGLHYHLLVNRRMSIYFIRRIGERYGMGRISVDKRPAGPHSGKYLSKYLVKDVERPLHGVARWGPFGNFCHVRKNDVVIESPYMECRRRWVMGKVAIGYETIIRRVWELHGEIGMVKVIGLLEKGRTAKACSMVSPHVRVTSKGGLQWSVNPRKYMRLYERPIPFQIQRHVSA